MKQPNKLHQAVGRGKFESGIVPSRGARIPEGSVPPDTESAARKEQLEEMPPRAVDSAAYPQKGLAPGRGGAANRQTALAEVIATVSKHALLQHDNIQCDPTALPSAPQAITTRRNAKYNDSPT